jgi:hypothetical protein
MYRVDHRVAGERNGVSNSRGENEACQFVEAGRDTRHSLAFR